MAAPDNSTFALRQLLEELAAQLRSGVEKLGELRQKVSEAFEKGEITSEARASAIDDALLGFAASLSDAEE